MPLQVKRVTFDAGMTKLIFRVVTYLYVRIKLRQKFHVRSMPPVVWMADQPLVIGKLYNLKVGTQTVPAKVTAINYRTNVNTLEKVQVDSL